jgi:hypothetical protein
MTNLVETQDSLTAVKEALIRLAPTIVALLSILITSQGLTGLTHAAYVPKPH